jgi:hypothetical protein
MDRTVRDHIKDLGQRRDLLNVRITEESGAEQRNQLETALRAVESTLKSYRDALESQRRFGDRHRVDENFSVTVASKLFRPAADL